MHESFIAFKKRKKINAFKGNQTHTPTAIAKQLKQGNPKNTKH